MKVLIIVNDSVKLDNAIRMVKRYFKSAQVVHVNNYNDAVKTCYTKREINEFNLIIIDMVFCRADPHENPDPVLHPQAGSMFLSHLAKRKTCTPVIIYSTTKDYLKDYKEFLFPSFETICDNFDSHPLFVEGSDVDKLYREITVYGNELLNASNFVIGHAHTLAELEKSIYKLRNLMKKAG